MTEAYINAPDERIDWIKSIPFIIVHVLGIAAFFVVEWGITEVVLCIAMYYVRMFFITAGYHRYFSHRSYKMGRVMQFLMALGGTTATQKGVLWWAGHHRHHHKYSDQPNDVHSPKKGLLWSHVGWILCNKYDETPWDNIKDFARFPELRWLNRWHLVPPTVLAVGLFLVGGASWLFWGFFLSTTILWHGTFTINSLMHLWGRRRYVTTDTSRNSMILALITCGEGWHNNHHYYQSTANQGFFWWELDFSYYVLKALSWVGLVKDLRTPSEAVLRRNLIKDGHHDVGMLGPIQEKVADVSARARAAADKLVEGAARPMPTAE